MDTNLIIGIVAAVVIVVLLIVWGVVRGKSRKNEVDGRPAETATSPRQAGRAGEEPETVAATVDRQLSAPETEAKPPPLEVRESVSRSNRRRPPRPSRRLPHMMYRKNPARAFSGSRRNFPGPRIRSARRCSTSSPKTTSPNPIGRTSRTRCCWPTSVPKQASS